jgi:hypothetical protein
LANVTGTSGTSGATDTPGIVSRCMKLMNCPGV